MPYIHRVNRDYFNDVLEQIKKHSITNGGELNYLFTQLICQYLSHSDKRYENYNTIVGALECCKLELYRRLIAPYETEKEQMNGDAYNVE